MTASTDDRAAPAAAAYRLRWAALFVILAGEIMDLLDALVTNIAAPTIRADLGGSSTLMQWLGAGYTLAMAVGLLTGGRLGDLYGRKRMFLVGAAGFTLGSLLCAVAQSPEMLVGSRVLQGLLGAVMLPQGLGMIKEMFPPREMGTAFGAFGPIMGLSSVGGPILAGWLIDADLFGTGWRMIFLINLPLGLAALIAGARVLPGSKPSHASRLDPLGMLLASAAAALVVYPLVQGRELGWPVWTFGLMACSVLLFAVFAWYQRRVQERGGDPLVEPGLFRKRAFSGGLVVGLVFFSGMTGFSLVFSLYTQLGLGYSPLKAGLAGVPWSAGMIVGFGIAQVVQRFGRAVIHAGTVIMAAGVAGFVVTLSLAGTDVGPWQLSPALTVTGLGMGLLMAPFFDLVLAGVEPHESGSAGGTLTAVQQLGSALGVALLGTVFFGLLGSNVQHGADAVTPRLRGELTAAGVDAPRQESIVTNLRACGGDRARAGDPARTPASCTRLEQSVRTAAVAGAGAGVGRAVTAAGTTAAKEGFGSAMKITLWCVAGMLALTFLVAFLLPPHAREEHAESDGHEENDGHGENEGGRRPAASDEATIG